MNMLLEKEALVGVGPTMADLQSAALATWLQRLVVITSYQKAGSDHAP
jgi:hypothetical protein